MIPDTPEELWKGLTDVPIVLFSFLFFVLLWAKHRRRWSILFLMISVSALFGAFVHSFALSDAVTNGIWMVLYVLLFEDVRRASLLLSDAVRGRVTRERRSVFVCEAAVYTLTVVGMFVFPFNEIFLFAGFAGWMLFRMILTVVREKKPSVPVVCLGSFLTVALIFQFLEGALFYAIPIEHLFLLLAMYAAYRIGCDSPEDDGGQDA